MIVRVKKGEGKVWWKDIVWEELTVGPGVFSPKVVWTVYEGPHKNKVIKIKDTEVVDSTIHSNKPEAVYFERIR